MQFCAVPIRQEWRGGSGDGGPDRSCLVVQCGVKKDDIISQRPIENGESLDAVEFKSGRMHIFRYNIVADNIGTGLYYDCHMIGSRVIGNAFWNNRGFGVYNEYGANDTMVIGNYFLKNALVSSWCTRLSVLENFFQSSSVVWANHDRWPFRNSFMTMRRQRNGGPAPALPDDLRLRLGAFPLPGKLPPRPGGLQPRPRSAGRAFYRRRRQKGGRRRESPLGVRMGAHGDLGV